MIVKGKGAMVWRLREWQAGHPQAQADHAKALGLSWVSIKIVDGLHEKWEGSIPNQNADLITDTIAALNALGILAIGWGWVRGRIGGRSGRREGVPSAARAREEARKAIELCRRYGLKHFQVDAETEWVAASMASVATAYCEELSLEGPEIEQSLDSYRFPLTYQQDFPVHQFAPHMEGWSPQVYFLQDNRPHGGAAQLEVSFRQYQDQIRELPYFPIAPTYPHRFKDANNQWQTWRASGEQLRLMMEKAVELGCLGFGIWDLPQATTAQLMAIKDFAWPGSGTPPPGGNVPPWVGADMRAIAGAVRTQAEMLDNLADQVDRL